MSYHSNLGGTFDRHRLIIRIPSMWPTTPLQIVRGVEEAQIKDIRYHSDCDLVLFSRGGIDSWLVLDQLLTEGWLVKEV